MDEIRGGDQKMPDIDKSWTLFLDRDGVVNYKLENDYVKKVEEFKFLANSPEAISWLSEEFGRIILVTNQQGIGKGIMTEDDLAVVHDHMLEVINQTGGKLDAIFYAPHRAEKNSIYRKPGTGMAYKAQERFPEIDFRKSIMVGDSITDMQFGKQLGMITVFVSKTIPEEFNEIIDYHFASLFEFAKAVVEGRS